jgi:TM2 domain-containing membrane protein YozV
VVIGGLSVEIGRLFQEAIGNSRSALDGRRRNLPKRFEGPQTAAVLPEAEPLSAVKPAAAEPSPTSSPIAVPSGGSVTVINQMPVKRWSPGVAAVLTFFIPGLGQIYKGQVINGLVWFFLVTMGYAALILPGLILHFFCIIGALSGNPWTESKTTVVRQ